MKFRYTKILAGMAMAMGLWGCTDEVSTPQESLNPDADAITFTLSMEGRGLSTRSGESNISDGSMVNRLYYAVYRKKADSDDFELDKYFHPGDEKYKLVTNYGKEEKEKFLIKLIPNKNDNADQVYKILCWAQYEVEDEDNKGVFKSPYYTFDSTGEIKNINVSYTNALNNDESRDAFCASQEFTAAQRGTVAAVFLTRPFAQINVGTSGWDVEGLAKVEPEKYVVKYSKITVKGLSNKFDLLNDVVKNDDLQEVPFEFNTIPAYAHLADIEDLDFDNLSSDDLTGIFKTDHDEDTGIFPTKHVEEEFLLINFPKEERPVDPKDEDNYAGKDNPKGTYSDYIGWSEYDGFCATSGSHEQLLYDIYTETFKYLSMCYVLVPFSVETNDQGKERKRSTVDLKFDCSAEKIDGEYKRLYDPKNVIELNNVPVCSNFRTNIIAADGTGFFMNSNQLNVAIYSESYSDYYKNFEAEDKTWEDNESDKHGKDENGNYKWPEDDINPGGGTYHDFDFTLPMVSLGSYEWNPIKKEENNSIDLDFYLEPVDKENPENYGYKVWIELDGEVFPMIVALEKSDTDNKGKYKVSVPQEVFQKMCDEDISSINYFAQVMETSTETPKASIKSSNITADLTIKPQSWIFAGGTGDTLGGKKFYDNFKDMQSTNDPFTDHGLTAMSGWTASKNYEIKKNNNNILLNNTGSQEYCHLRFTIYSSCKVTVSLTKAADKERWIIIDWTDKQVKTTPDKKSTDYTGFAEVTLSDVEKNNGKTVYIYGGGNDGASQNIKSIKLEPVK